MCYTGMPVWSGDSGEDRTCVTLACLYSLETVALTERVTLACLYGLETVALTEHVLHWHACMVWRQWR